MEQSDDAVVERVTVREAAGIFRSREALEKAIDALQLAGFNRSSLAIMARTDVVREKLADVYAPVRRSHPKPSAASRAFMLSGEATGPLSGVAGLLAFIGATTAAASVVASGGALAIAAVAASAGGMFAGGLGAWFAAALGDREAARLEEQLAAEGIVLWVRLRSPDRDAIAQEVLSQNGAEDVRVLDVAVEKRLEDIPLSSLLSDERVT
jgi:hypothetical protein